MAADRDGTSGGGWWGEDLAERQKVLLHVLPLAGLRRDDRAQTADAQHYDSLALALRVLELVLEASDLDQPVTTERLHAALRPALAAMDRAREIEPDPERHERVVERVLGALRNDEDQRRPFQFAYSTFGVDGEHRLPLLDFDLLKDTHHPDGRVVLRATAQGANIFLRALAMDLASQQAATEAIVELQLRRGLFDQAVAAARTAYLTSGLFVDELRALLDQTRRDLSRVDWHADVPARLQDMRVHLELRLDVEHRLLEAADLRLQELEPGSESARQVASVRRLLGECQLRHRALHLELIDSRLVFLKEQTRQSFVPRAIIARPCILDDLLEPVLAAPMATGVGLAARAIALLMPPVPPGVPWLPLLLEDQLEPPRSAPQPREESGTRDLVDVPEDPPHFPPAVRAAGDRLLATLPGPVALSTLLKAGEGVTAARAVREYLVLRALQAAAPEPPTADAPQGPPLPDIEGFHPGALDTPEFVGDDLVLAPPAPPRDHARD